MKPIHTPLIAEHDRKTADREGWPYWQPRDPLPPSRDAEIFAVAGDPGAWASRTPPQRETLGAQC